jgi:hypothetical protein
MLTQLFNAELEGQFLQVILSCLGKIQNSTYREMNVSCQFSNEEDKSH